MSKLFKSKFFLGTLVVAAMFAFAGLSNATPAAADCSITVTLKVGSTGPEVSCLQAIVGAKADGKFGPMTATAVKAWQAGHGLTADGVVGPKTRAAMLGQASACTGAFDPMTGKPCGSVTVAGCLPGYMFSPTTGAKCDGSTPSTPTTVSGTDGTIADVTKLSQYNNEEVGADKSDVKVLGFEVKASKEGDIALKSVKISTAITNASGSTRLENYVKSVTLWMGSTKIGSADAADFNKDSTGNYSKTIAVSDAVVKADVTNKFYVTFDAPSVLDSGDIDSEVFTVGVDNIRYVDGSGVYTTDSTTGDLTTNLDAIGVNFVSYATSADTKLKVQSDSTNPTAGIVIVDSTSNTDGVTLLKGKLTLDGTSDVTLNSFPITLTAGGATNIDALTGNLTLVIDGQEFSESTGANCSVTCATNSTATVTFDNLDLALTAGDTVNFSVKADINNVDAVSMDEGDTLTASFTSTNLSQMDAENSHGDQLTSSERSGTLTGKAQEFRTQGIALTLVSTDATSSNDTGANNDTGTFKIRFKVTAIGEDAYVATYTPGTYYPYTVDVAGVATTGGVSAVITNLTDSTLTDAYNWKINAGESETLELTIAKTYAGGTGLFRAALNSVLWSSSDDNTPGNTYSSNMDSFKTDYVNLN